VGRELYFCKDCGYESRKWLGRCPGCGAWNSFAAAPAPAKAGRGAAARGAAPVPVTEAAAAVTPRLATGLAGADRVLFPHGLGGRRIAQMAIRPHVTEFLELVMHDEDLELWLEELTVAIGSRLDGCAIGDAHIRRETGANIVALRQRTGKLLTAPGPKTVLQAGDILVALGTRQALEALRQMTTQP